MEVILDGAKQEVKRVAVRISGMLGAPAANEGSRTVVTLPDHPAAVQ
jgi:hypothetical protein